MFPDTGMARVTDWVPAFSGSALKVVQVVPSTAANHRSRRARGKEASSEGDPSTSPTRGIGQVQDHGIAVVVQVSTAPSSEHRTGEKGLPHSWSLHRHVHHDALEPKGPTGGRLHVIRPMTPVSGQRAGPWGPGPS